jgi:hypothetical protein
MSKAQGIAQSANQGNFKNRIINGAMVIDQRNAGASVTPANAQYTLDRYWWQVSQTSKLTNQKSTVAPTGFSNSFLVTSSSAYSVLTGDYFAFGQQIEGFNTADLGWGTASASSVTLSFWVRSSLTGTFGGSVINGAFNRSYPFTYTISTANTWEQKSITIAGDTTGTWVGATNGSGMQVFWGLGVGSTFSGTAGAWTGSGLFSATGATSVVGTNGATFYITGVQLEKGSTATSFDYRPYGTELALCQRYYLKISNSANSLFGLIGQVASGTTSQFAINLAMRTTPTCSVSNVAVNDTGANSAISAIVGTTSNVGSVYLTMTQAPGLTSGRAATLIVLTGGSGYIDMSAEL